MNAYHITAGELGKRGKTDIPPELKSSEHLIYSSPATLAFNSPGANGFGVKRAGLSVPGSVMLLVSPGCCGRNTTLESTRDGYRDRFFFLLQDSTDIVTGRHIRKITDAVCRIAEEKKPSCVMVCITCVDALLGTDMEKVCSEASRAAGIPVVPCYMYALTREKKLPPMASVRRSVYSMLEKRPKRANQMNIIGFFSPLNDDCELYDIMRSVGIKKIGEISRCRDFEEYKALAEANFNLVLNPESLYAAGDMKDNLGLPYIQINRMYRPEKIRKQYELLLGALGVSARLDDYHEEAVEELSDFGRSHGSVRFAVGECLNADPFELSLALIAAGHEVPVIFGTVGDSNFHYIKMLGEISPGTKIYSNLSPTMMFFDESENPVDFCIGADASYYYGSKPPTDFTDERQPFGYAGLRLLINRIEEALK